MAHAHQVVDGDRVFVIDPETRAISYESNAKLQLIQYDHNSERFTFQLPRYIEDHDMSLCNRVRVHFVNIGDAGRRNSDVQELIDLAVVHDDEDYLTCSWLVSQNATMYAGSLNFVIQFACLTDDIIDYAWHTGVSKAIQVGEGMNNGESVVEQYSDILEQWLHNLTDAGIVAVSDITRLRDESIAAMQAAYKEMDPVEAVNAVRNAQVEAVAAVNKAFEDLDVGTVSAAIASERDSAVTQIENATSSELTEALNTLSQKTAESINDVKTTISGLHGVITLTTSGWNSSKTNRVDFADLEDNDIILFRPNLLADYTKASDAGIYVNAHPGYVNFVADIVPTKTIDLSYVIIKTKVGSGVTT